MSTADKDRSERLRAFDAAVEHRDAVHRLVDEMKSANSHEEVARIEAEMNRVGYEYEASLQANTVRLQAQNDQRSAELREQRQRRT